MLLSCSLGTLDCVICSWQRLLLAHSTFPHTPACTSILGWQIPLAATVAAQNKMDFAGRCLTLLLGVGPDPVFPLQGRHKA